MAVSILHHPEPAQDARLSFWPVKNAFQARLDHSSKNPAQSSYSVTVPGGSDEWEDEETERNRPGTAFAGRRSAFAA